MLHVCVCIRLCTYVCACVVPVYVCVRAGTCVRAYVVRACACEGSEDTLPLGFLLPFGERVSLPSYLSTLGALRGGLGGFTGLSPFMLKSISKLQCELCEALVTYLFKCSRHTARGSETFVVRGDIRSVRYVTSFGSNHVIYGQSTLHTFNLFVLLCVHRRRSQQQQFQQRPPL